MIYPIHSIGASRARVVCDRCAREDTVACRYEVVAPHRTAPVEAHVISKIQNKGWLALKKAHLCPLCAAGHRAAQAEAKEEKKQKGEDKMAMNKGTNTSAELRQPTLEQRGEILEMLVEVYDRKNKRYKGAETDKTVADVVGKGCLPGWVAELRERDFGPSGSNEEIEALRADIDALDSDYVAKLASLKKRLDAVCAAVGPKAARV